MSPLHLSPLNKPAASIIIRCCNEEQHIGRLLTGIFAQSYKDIEVILVDSGSTDRTVEIASSFPVRVLNIDSHLFSFGRSLNLGCREARGDILVLVSAHVYPVRFDWLSQIIRPLQDSRVALCYGKQSGNGRTKYSEHQIFARWFPEESVSEQTTPFCNNANAALRKSVWEAVQYNERLTGLEDLAWAKRVLELGYVLAYSAEAEIIHEHDESYARIYHRYFREALAFRRIFPEQRFRFVNFLSLFAANCFTDFVHAVRDGKLLRNLMAIPAFRFMQFWGTYRGFGFEDRITDSLRQRFYYPRGLARRSLLPGRTFVPTGDTIDYSRREYRVEA